MEKREGRGGGVERGREAGEGYLKAPNFRIFLYSRGHLSLEFMHLYAPCTPAKSKQKL